MKAVILANETSVKLAPLVEGTSLATVPVINKTVIEHLLEQLAEVGVTQTIVAAKRPNGEIEHLWDNKRKPATPLRFSFAYDNSSGAAALNRLKNDLRETFIVVDCQHLVRVDLKLALQQHRQSGAAASVVAVRVATPWAAALKAAYEIAGSSAGTQSVAMPPEFGMLRIAPEACEAGLYLFEPEALNCLPDSKNFNMQELLVRLLGQGHRVNTCALDGEIRELNTPSNYWRSCMEILADTKKSWISSADALEIKPGIWVGSGTKIHPNALLKAPLVIGRNCKIQQDAKLDSCIIGDDVIIGQGAEIRQSVIFAKTRVGLAVKLNESLVRGNLLCQGPNFEAEWVGDLHCLGVVNRPELGPMFKRAFNLAIALLLVLVLAPALLLIALAIKLDSPGPIFYKQLRVGQGRPGGRNLRSGRVFKMYKFRTMHVNADAKLLEMLKQNEYKNQAFVKIKNDPRITWIGGFLRKTSLDELPQLINVLLGDMQLVGNRPLPIYEAEALSEEWQKLRFNAPAGMTGLWQISGRSDLSAEERLLLDNYYAATNSFWNDLKILLMTIPAMVKFRGAR